MNNADVPAMPQEWEAYVEGNAPSGLTKREEFAKAAMRGLLSFYGDRQQWDLTAREAVKCAGALLAELEKESVQ